MRAGLPRHGAAQVRCRSRALWLGEQGRGVLQFGPNPLICAPPPLLGFAAKSLVNVEELGTLTPLALAKTPSVENQLRWCPGAG